MTRVGLMAPLLVTSLILGGCMQDKGNKEIIGTLGGAAAGGYLGSKIGSGSGQMAAMGLGVLLGGMLGGEIGKSLDEYDKMKMSQTTQRALETSQSGSSLAWNNPDSGNSGTVTPTRTYQVQSANNSSQPCREFQQTVNVGGKSQEAYGTACRQPDGTWKIVENAK